MRRARREPEGSQGEKQVGEGKSQAEGQATGAARPAGQEGVAGKEAAADAQAGGAATTATTTTPTKGPPSRARPLSPLGRAIVAKEDPEFERQHLQNARMGELLMPVRQARRAALATPASAAAVANLPADAADGTGGAGADVTRPSSAFAATRHVSRNRKKPQAISRDIVLSPKKWKLAGRNVEPLGWFDPFADRFPNMENAGAGRDFTRVPAKFPNVTQAERDENFRLWLKEKDRLAREARTEQRERSQSFDGMGGMLFAQS